MTAFPFCLFGVEIASLPWRRRAPISVGLLQKANWLGRVLYVHITLLDLLWRMAVCLMARQCIRNLVWRSAPAMDSSKCADLSAKDARLANHGRTEIRNVRQVFHKDVRGRGNLGADGREIAALWQSMRNNENRGAFLGRQWSRNGFRNRRGKVK